MVTFDDICRAENEERHSSYFVQGVYNDSFHGYISSLSIEYFGDEVFVHITRKYKLPKNVERNYSVTDPISMLEKHLPLEVLLEVARL